MLSSYVMYGLNMFWKEKEKKETCEGMWNAVFVY